MKDLVLDLVTCWENRTSMVEVLVSDAYYAAATLDGSLSKVAEERERLKNNLQEILARNCSLRKKDFNTLMDRTISDSETKKLEIEEEGVLVREQLKGYLDEQKQLVTSLRQQMVQFTLEKASRDVLDATMDKIKATYQQKGQEVFALLRNFQLRLESYQREQEEINHKLTRLMEKGESLRVEDLRQLKAAKAGQERKSERELRRQEVERLLAHFNQQRQGFSRHRL